MVREPQQERSRATLEHILDAAEAILRVRTFDNASIQAICARAGVTTGAFYARFEGKSALLTAILERQQKLMTERITALREAAALARYSELAQRIGLLVRTSIDFYRSQKGTLLPLRTQALDH